MPTMMRAIVPVILAVTAAAPALAQKQEPPPVGTPKDLKLPPRHEISLPNGMAVTLVPFGTVPKAAVVLAVRAGRVNERTDQVWLSQLTADLMQEGTRTISSAKVAEL
ncbi:MAG TPA: hypothetical protein VFD73_01990, partial [Gemmatimonadales bacterium]|nr:hypothetical protein [Gemmatimonadales bacterium]